MSKGQGTGGRGLFQRAALAIEWGTYAGNTGGRSRYGFMGHRQISTPPRADQDDLASPDGRRWLTFDRSGAAPMLPAYVPHFVTGCATKTFKETQ